MHKRAGLTMVSGGMDETLRNLRLAWGKGPEGRECESTERIRFKVPRLLRGETRRGKLRWAQEFEIAGEGHRFTRVESCRPWPSLLSFWSLNSGARSVVYIHFLVIGVVGDAAFPRASARLCFWFPCLEGEEPRLCCTKCMRCDILGKGDSKRPAKKKPCNNSIWPVYLFQHL